MPSFWTASSAPVQAACRPLSTPLPHLSTTGVADVLQLARARILRFLARKGVVDVDDDAITVLGDLPDRDPVLAALAAASVSGLPPAGPARRKPMIVPLPGRPGVEISAHLCVNDLGFGLHAATRAGAEDARGRAALVKYVLRPPLANERLEIGPGGNVHLLLKKPFKDGTTVVEMSPLALLARLAAAVPSPRRHTVGYAGCLSSAAKLRPLVVPQTPPASDGQAPAHSLPPATAPPTRRRCRRPYLELLARTFGDDLAACETCGGRMRLLSLVKDPESIGRFLESLGEPTEPPPLAPARGPPFFSSPPSARHGAPFAPEPFDEPS